VLNRESKVRIILVWITVALILATLLFIWGNSCQPKQVSAKTSQSVYEKVEPVLSATFGKGVITHEIFRKIAHSVEFMLLGVELVLFTCLVYGTPYKYTFQIIAFGFAVAGLDESIQIISRRGPRITDVLIDGAGLIFAIALIYLLRLIVYLIQTIIAKKKHRKQNAK